MYPLFQESRPSIFTCGEGVSGNGSRLMLASRCREFRGGRNRRILLDSAQGSMSPLHTVPHAHISAQTMMVRSACASKEVILIPALRFSAR
jgi:hypothetical protein